MPDQAKKIFIDADACPVKEEVYRIAIRNNTEVLVVCNGGIRPHQNPLIKLKIVNEGLAVSYTHLTLPTTPYV